MNSNGTAGAEQILINNEWCQQFTSHSTGHLAFGPDGNLYVSGGDGGELRERGLGPVRRQPAEHADAGEPVRRPARRQGRREHVADRPWRRDAVAEPAPARGSRGCSAARVLRLNPDTGAGVSGNPMYNAASAVGERVAHHRLRHAQPVPVHLPARHQRALGRRRRLGPLRGDQPHPDAQPREGAELRLAVRRGPDPPVGLPRPRHVQGALQRHRRPTHRPRTSRTSTARRSTPTTPARFADGTAITGVAFYTGNRYPASYANSLFFADDVRNCIYVMTARRERPPDPSTARTFIDDSDNPAPVDLEVGPGVEGHLLRQHRGGDRQPHLVRVVEPGARRRGDRDADLRRGAALRAAERLGVDRPGRRHAHLLVGHRRQRQLRRRDRQDTDGELRLGWHLPPASAR